MGQYKFSTIMKVFISGPGPSKQAFPKQDSWEGSNWWNHEWQVMVSFPSKILWKKKIWVTRFLEKGFYLYGEKQAIATLAYTLALLERLLLWTINGSKTLSIVGKHVLDFWVCQRCNINGNSAGFLCTRISLENYSN